MDLLIISRITAHFQPKITHSHLHDLTMYIVPFAHTNVGQEIILTVFTQLAITQMLFLLFKYLP